MSGMSLFDVGHSRNKVYAVSGRMRAIVSGPLRVLESISGNGRR
jgi:hypothetical protein